MEELDNEEKKPILKILIIIASIVLILTFLVFFFRVKNIKFEGNTFYSQEKMMEMFQPSFLEWNTLSFFLLEKMHLTPMPEFVREYEVEYMWPGDISIKLYEKTIIAGIVYNNQYIYFDKDGMVLQSANKPVKNIPLFEIKSVTTFSLYTKVKMEDEDLLERIMNLANLFQHYKVSWDKVQFDDSKNVFLYAKNIKVNMGKRENYDEQVSALSSILPQILKRNKKGEIDLSNYQVKGDVIFKEIP